MECASAPAVQVDRRVGGESLAAANHDVLSGVLGKEAAVVVATEDRENRTVADADAGGGVGSGGISVATDDSILGATENGVNIDAVADDTDGGFLDRRDRGCSGEGSIDRGTVGRGVALDLAGGEGLGDGVARTVELEDFGANTVGVVVVAVAAAVDRADDDVGSLLAAADSDLGTIGTKDLTGDIVAAKDGTDSLALLDIDIGLAVNVSHTAATKHGAFNQRTYRCLGRCRRHDSQQQSKHCNAFKRVSHITFHFLHCMNIYAFSSYFYLLFNYLSTGHNTPKPAQFLAIQSIERKSALLSKLQIYYFFQIPTPTPRKKILKISKNAKNQSLIASAVR